MEAVMAIVPVKPFAHAKTRLAGVLRTEERVALATRLLKRTLLKVTRAQGIACVVVVSSDPAALKIARTYGAWSVIEAEEPNSEGDLNAALERAQRVCLANGAQAILVVPTDLPRLRVRDLEQMIALGEPAPHVVIAPARRDGGTNALLVAPAGAISFRFGKDSCAQHVTAAEDANVPVALYESDTVSLDLDLPEDLELLHAPV